jgi:phospholipase/carboxylesterase
METDLETLEQETGARPQHSVIWLHGLGADGHDFAPIVPELAQEDLPALRFVFPHAPVRPVTLNQGLPMRAWYDAYGIARDSHEDVAGIRAAGRAITALIQREQDRGVPPEHIVLAGFSQGCAAALYTGLRFEHRLAGVIGLSGYLPLRNTTAAERHPSNADTPVFLAHGSQDPVIPVDFATISRDTLAELGQPVEWHVYPMPHAVHPQEIEDIHAFLVRVLNPAAPGSRPSPPA